MALKDVLSMTTHGVMVRAHVVKDVDGLARAKEEGWDGITFIDPMLKKDKYERDYETKEEKGESGEKHKGA